MRFFVIADPYTYLAFALAGVEGGEAAATEDARRLFAKAREDPEVGVILITEGLAAALQPEVDEQRWEGGTPLVVEIPALSGPLPRTETLLERLHVLMGLPK